jgi:MFS family permease
LNHLFFERRPATEILDIIKHSPSQPEAGGFICKQKMDPRIRQSLRHNLTVNLLDGAFFGFALGFASFVTIIPLFVQTMTDSAILIGLIPAIHSMGWQLPQLLTANRVSQQKRFKPMVLWMTLHERLPFLGLAVLAWLLPSVSQQTALVITYILLIWQGLGGGSTATAWQSMIGKIIPSSRRGTFYGAQSAVANLLASLGAIIAGFILERLTSPGDFALNFLFASLCMLISWSLLASTHEPENLPVEPALEGYQFWNRLREILREDGNFRWFIIVRMLSQFAVMASAFYTVFAVGQLGLSEASVGLMTGVLMGTQIAVNPVLGWIGDRWSHRAAMQIGVAASALSGLVAWWAPSANWFYLVFSLAGVANASIWTVGLAMVAEFGTESQRPAYIGLANTLIAPATILAPFVGGWIAEASGYPSTFLVSAAAGLVTFVVLQRFVRDPRRLAQPSTGTLGVD